MWQHNCSSSIISQHDGFACPQSISGPEGQTGEFNIYSVLKQMQEIYLGFFLLFLWQMQKKAFLLLLNGHLRLQQNFALLMRDLLEAVAVAVSSLSLPINISALCPPASEVLGTLYNTSY